ncbi:hypothetical protein BG000_007688, partial [Podila horticola]
MDSNVKQQAKKVIDTLYSWLFDGEGYTPPAPTGQCVKEYVDGDEVTSGSIIHRVLGSLGNAKGRYASLHDHAVAVATSAASAISTIVAKHDHIGAATTGIPGQGHVPRPSSTFFDNSREAIDSDSLISFFRSFYDNPSAAFDDLLGHHYPHFDSLISHLGLDELAKNLNCDSRILFLACLLPLIVLLLSTCCIMGAAYSAKEPHSPGYHEHKKSDPTKVGGKSDSQGPSPSVSNLGTGSTSSSSSSSAKGGKGKGKKGGARASVTEGSASTGSYHLGNSNLSSWGSMLGATGFRVADVLDFKPFDIYAAMDAAGHDHRSGMNGPKLSQNGGSIQADEDIIGSTKAQHDQDKVTLDNQEDYVENISDFAQEFVSAATARAKKLVHDVKEINTENAPQKVHSQADTKGKQGGPAGPDSEPQLRTRMPRPRSFKEADRHRHQPHIPSSSFTSSLSSTSRQRQDGFGNAVDQGHGDQHESIAAKIMNFAQGNSIMKNLDGISGGVLGATLATVAALANTAEAVTTSLKENVPNSVSDFINGLQESFDEAMENGGLEGTGFDDQPRVSRVQVSELPSETCPPKNVDSGSSVSATKKGSSSSTGPSQAWPSTYGPMANKNSKAAPFTSANSPKTGSTGTSDQTNKGHTMAANPPRLRQRSIGHIQSGMHATASSAAAPNPSRPAEAAYTPSTEDISCDPAIHHATPEPVIAPVLASTPKAATSGSHAHKSPRSQGISNVEDIGVGPKTKRAVYAEYVGKDPSESAVADPSVSSAASGAAAGSGLDKHTKSTKHTYSASGSHTAKDPTDPKEIARRAKIAAEAEEKGLKSGSSKSNVASAFGQKPGEKVAHAADKVTNDVKTAASKTKDQAKNTEGSIDNAAKDKKKHVDKAVGKTNDSPGLPIPSAQKAKGAVVHHVKEKVKEADKTAKKVASDALKAVDSGLTSVQKTKDDVVHDVQNKTKQADSAIKKTAADAQKAKDTVIHDAKEKVKEVDATAKKVALDTKKTVEAGVSYAQKAKSTLVKDAHVVVHGAETTAEAVVSQAKAIANSAVATAQHAADVAVYVAQDTVLQADIALHDAADATQKSMRKVSDTVHHLADQTKAAVGSTTAIAKHDIEEAEHLAKETVTSTVSAAQRTKDSVVHAAEDAVHEAEAILDAAVNQGKDNVGVLMTVAHAVTDTVVANAKDALKSTERNAETAAKNVKKNIASAVTSAQQDKNMFDADATEAANKTSKDAKTAVDSASGAAHKAEKKIRFAAQKAKNNASHAAKDVGMEVESTIKAATTTAQKVKDNATQAVKDAEKKVEDTVQSATAAAQKVKDSATQAAMDIHKQAESAVDSAFNAAMKAKFDASHVAKEVEKSVESAKKTIGHGMHAASSSQKVNSTSAKDLHKAANTAGQSAKVAEEDVQAAIKAAMEYALKTTNDAPIRSAKANLDSAIASAHKTENHIAQNLKNAAHKAESVAHKASGDAKAALDSALVAAHEAGNNHTDAHSVHLGAASTLNAPAHLHHADHTHDIKKVFVYGHNSPRLGNKETRFVSGSPPSSSSSDPKPELKAAHNAHHAHHDGATSDGTQKMLKAPNDNRTGGEYKFLLHENDLLDDANADDGGEEDSDEDDRHDQPGHDGLGILSAAPSHENDLLDDANADDGGEEDSDEDDHHDQPSRDGRGILSAAPSILQSAKTAASAVASRVADASHQRLNHARHRLSSIVDHMADNLAGHDEWDDDDIDDEDEDHDSTLLTKNWSTTSGP